MGTKSRDGLDGSLVRIATERAAEARREADRLACDAWTKRILAFKGPAQPSPTLGDALNAGYLYLEVRCLGCDTDQTVALDIVEQPAPSAMRLVAQFKGRAAAYAQVKNLRGPCPRSLTFYAIRGFENLGFLR
jgi:hypothetical protein